MEHHGPGPDPEDVKRRICFLGNYGLTLFFMYNVVIVIVFMLIF